MDIDIESAMRRQLEREAVVLGLEPIPGEDNHDLSARIDIAKEAIDDWDEDDAAIAVDVWTQRDGTKIRLCDMSDSHLRNAFNLIQRRGRMGDKIWHRRIYEEIERRRELAPPEILCSQCGEPLRQLEDAFACDPCGRMVDGINWDF